MQYSLGRRLAVSAAIAGIIAAIVAVITFLANLKVEAQATPTRTITVAVTLLESATGGALPASQDPVSAQGQGNQPTAVSNQPPLVLHQELFLDAIDPIEDELNPESITWGAETFSRSLTNPLSGCSQVGPVDWVVPFGWSQLETEIGVGIDAVEPESRVTFNIYLDGTRAVSQTLAVGEHMPIEVSVVGVSRIRFETIIDKSRRGNCNTEATAVWGDPRFVP